MGKVKAIIYKLLIILISLCFIDGGRSFLLISDNVQIILNHNHTNDFEIPHQHQTGNFSSDEKWIESISFDFSSTSNTSVRFLYSLSAYSQDFSDSIWQPPKFV